MALNYKQVSIPLVNGVDTKTDSKLNSAPLEVVNAFVERDGVLRKKFGDVQLNKDVRTEGAPYSISSGVNAASYLNDLAINTEDGFYVYLESSEEWKEHEKYRLCSVSDSKVSRNKGDTSADGIEGFGLFSIASNEDYSINSQLDSSNTIVTASVYSSDKVSGNLLDTLSSDYNIRHCNPVSNGNDLGCVTRETEAFSSGTRVSYYRLLNGYFESRVDISTNCRTSGGIVSVSDGFYIAILQDSKYKILKVNYSGVVVATRDLNDFNTYGASSIAINELGRVEVVTISDDATSLEYYILSLDLSTEISSSTLTAPWLSGADILTGINLASTCTKEGFYVFMSIFPDFSNGHDSEVTLSSFYSENASSTLSLLHSVNKESGLSLYTFIQSQAVSSVNSAMVHIVIVQSSGVMRNFLIDQDFSIIATISELNSRFKISDSEHSAALPEIFRDNKTLFVPYVENIENSLLTVELDTTSSDPIQFQETLIYPSGSPVLYNGHTFFSSPFSCEPIISAENGAGGQNTGDYLYKAVFKLESSAGNVYRSGTSNEVELTSSSDTVNVKISPLFTSPTGFGLLGRYSVEVYQAELETGLYRLAASSAEIQPGQGLVVSILNPAMNTSPFLYTTGDIVAELENAAPPALSDIVWHNGRVFGISSRFNELRYSKIYVRGEGLAFVDEFTIPVEDNQGRRSERATALASLDSRLIIFKPNSILVISGDGPDNAGQNNDFTEPELITADVGCNNPKSVVLTGDGVFFQSKKGIYLLDRSLSVSYVGAGIEQFKDDVINSALLMEERELLKFTTNEGRVLLYNHFYKQWTWYDDHENAVSAVNWKGDYGYIDSSGSVFIEDQTTHRKNGDFTKRNYDTGWLKLTGIQNYQRVRKLLISGEYKDSHQLKVTLSYDYDDSTEEDYILSPQSGEDYQYSIHLRRQKSQSIRIQIEDVDTGATDEGFKITDITLEAGIKKGLNKFTSDRSY